MEFRSTADSYVHYTGDVVTNVGSSHGVHLTGGSTGAIVQPAGDDTNTGILVRAKGTGAVTLGNSSNTVGIRSNFSVGSSGSSMSEIRSFTVQFTAPTMSSGIDGGSTISTVTVTGVSTGTVLHFTPTNPISILYNVRPRCSTVNELVLNFTHNGISTLGSGESTNRGVLLQFRF